MLTQTEAVPQVVRRHLDGRFADRVGDFGDRVGVRLDHQDPRRRTLTADLQRQRERRRATADNADVVVRGGAIGVRKPRPDAFGEGLSSLLTHLRHLRSRVHGSPFLGSCPRVLPPMCPALEPHTDCGCCQGKGIRYSMHNRCNTESASSESHSRRASIARAITDS